MRKKTISCILAAMLAMSMAATGCSSTVTIDGKQGAGTEGSAGAENAGGAEADNGGAEGSEASESSTA